MKNFLHSAESFCEISERNDLDSLVQRFNVDYAVWLSNLTPLQRRIIESYKGMDYKKINAFMRFGNDCGLTDPELDHLEEDIDYISSALAIAKVPETVSVYRGLKLGYPPKDLKVGQYLIEDGFMSTTFSIEVAN